MKSMFVLFCLTVLIGINSFGQDFAKIPEKDVDTYKVKLARDFSNAYLSQLRDGSYYMFSDEAIKLIKDQLTEENQKTIYGQLKGEFGDFQQLEYVESWQQKGQSVVICRFKADFDKSKKKLEVRVVLNDNDKIAGFWIKPWSDMLR